MQNFVGLPFSGICCRIGDSLKFSAVFTKSSNCGFFCSSSLSTFCNQKKSNHKLKSEIYFGILL